MGLAEVGGGGSKDFVEAACLSLIFVIAFFLSLSFVYSRLDVVAWISLFADS